jgi:hypothetical protein
MPFYEFDTLGKSLKKYAAIALIAGAAGFYKGCDVGKEMERKSFLKEMYQQQEKYGKPGIEKLLER